MIWFNKNKKKTWKCPKVESAIRPVEHSEKLPVPLFTALPDVEEERDIPLPDHTAISSDDSCSDLEEPSYVPQHSNT